MHTMESEPNCFPEFKIRLIKENEFISQIPGMRLNKETKGNILVPFSWKNMGIEMN